MIKLHRQLSKMNDSHNSDDKTILLQHKTKLEPDNSGMIDDQYQGMTKGTKKHFST